MRHDAKQDGGTGGGRPGAASAQQDARAGPSENGGRRTVGRICGMLVAVLLVAAVPGAQAEVDGDCRIFIAGEDLALRSADDPSDAVALNASKVIEYTMIVPPETTGYRIILELGPRSQVVADERVPPGEGRLNVSGNFSLDGYSWVGSGVYRIHAEVESDDERLCTAAALVHFQPGKILTATMVAAGAAVAGGTAGLAGAVARALREAAEKLNALRHFKRSLTTVAQLRAAKG